MNSEIKWVKNSNRCKPGFFDILRTNDFEIYFVLRALTSRIPGHFSSSPNTKTPGYSVACLINWLAAAPWAFLASIKNCSKLFTGWRISLYILFFVIYSLFFFWFLQNKLNYIQYSIRWRKHVSVHTKWKNNFRWWGVGCPGLFLLKKTPTTTPGFPTTIFAKIPWHFFPYEIKHANSNFKCDALRDLVFLHNFKNVKNTRGGVLLLVKLHAKACNWE